ncbi:MliC family protein [Utexia brackfieldae]|uniref:MliC family protein n=1 Tax=Utexia brackfieldae TaxID=3074108 RepID=UPI00370DDD08
MKKLLSIMMLFTTIGFSHSTIAADTMTYSCNNGQSFTAAYPNEDQAVLYYQNQLFLLNIAQSANGARYVGEGWQLWTQGINNAMLSILPEDKSIASDGLNCEAITKTSAITLNESK